MASVNNVCRLCLSKDNLVWVFDKRFASGNNLKDVVFITTGVEVYEKDVISQKICNKCCHIAIKMFQFRNVSQKHDKYLKEQYKELIKTSSVEDVIPTTSGSVKTEKKVEPKKETKEVKPDYKIHQSIKDLLKIYPRLKLPTNCLKYNIEPWVMMEMDTVENYLKKETRNKVKRIRLSKPENRTAKKSTSAASTNIDPLLISSRSFMSAENTCERDTFNMIVQKKQSTTVGVREIDENLNGDDSLSDDDKITVKPKKRRLSDSDFFSDTDSKNSAKSKPLPKKNPVCESADELCLDKSVPLFICSICNSVHNNVKALKRHNYKHLRCQFCRSRFKTIDLKEAHIKSMCSVKNMMKHLPSVQLEKIELDLIMRIKYPSAFIGYPLIRGLQLNSCSTNESSDDELSGDDHSDDRTSGNEISENMTSEKEKKAIGFNDDDDVIEIFSDDDTNSPSGNKTSNSTPVCQKGIVPPPNITQGTVKSECSSTKSTVTGIVSSVTVPSLIFTVTPVISSIPPFVSTSPPIMSTTSSVMSSIPPAISTTAPVFETNPLVVVTTPSVISTASVISTTSEISTTPSVIPTTPTPALLMAPEDILNSSSIVKPEIQIKRSTVLDTIDPRLTDIKVLKELLTTHTEFKFEKEESSQTELPTNQSICVNLTDNSTELKHLKNVLFAYKIPISIKKGDFQVRYDFSYTKPKQPKKLCLWNDLIPIDVKVTNESSNKEGSFPDKISVVTSEATTPNASTPGITSKCTRTPAYTCNPTFISVPNQQMYSRNNSFSTLINPSTGLSNVQLFPQVVSSNYGFVNEAPGSKDLTYVLVRTNAAEQQSNTTTANSFTASNVQMYPPSVNGTSVPSKFTVATKSVAKDVRPGAKLAGLPKTPVSYLNDMRGPPNINPFLNVAVPKTSPGLSTNSMNNAPPNVSNSHSMIYNLQNSVVIQNKVPNPVPNLVPISSASSSNEAVPLFGTIRVKNVWELT